MSGGWDLLSLKEEDVTKMLVASTHIGTEKKDFQMDQYIYKRRSDGVHIINLGKTWEKLLLAARAIVAIEHPSEVFVISSRSFGQRSVLKFASYTGATPIAGRFTPGAFTNQIQAAFREPRLLVVTDPLFDRQPIVEASYVNIPVIAFANTDSRLRFVDIAIPCNNKSPTSVGLMWWLLAREVLRFRGTIPRDGKWDVVVDLFFYRDPDEAEKDEQATKEQQPVVPAKPDIVDYQPATSEVWGAEPQEETWIEEGKTTTTTGGGGGAGGTGAADDWASRSADWTKTSASAGANDWSAPSNDWKSS